MLCYFLLCSEVNQFYVCVYPLFWISSPLRSPQSIELYSWFSLVIYFIQSINSVYMSI